MGGNCCNVTSQEINQLGNNPSMLLETITGRNKSGPDINPWKLAKTRAGAHLENAESKATMKRAKTLIRNKMMSKFCINQGHLNEISQELRSMFPFIVDFIYEYIIEQNIQKLGKNNTKINEYIDLVFPRCLVEYMSAYSRQVFTIKENNPENDQIEERYQDQQYTTPLEKLINYTRLVFPNTNYDIIKTDYNYDALMPMLSQLVLAGVICIDFAADPSLQAKMFRDKYWRKVACEMIQLLENEEKYKGFNMQQLKRHAELNTLRSMNWIEKNTQLIAKQYNMIIDIAKDKERILKQKMKDNPNYKPPAPTQEDQVLNERNIEDKKTIVSLANGILDFYSWKQDSSLINEPEFNEVVELSSIKEPRVYRLLLKYVVSDISNDKFIYPYKFKGLCVVLLNLTLKSDGKEDYTKYAQPDDLNACLTTMKAKMDSLLVDSKSEAVQESLDAFNLIITTMVSVGVTGVREESIADIKKSLEIFKKVSTHRDPMIVRLSGMQDEYSGIDRSLYLKTLYTDIALFKVGKARPPWTKFATQQMRFNQFCSAISGIASIAKGISNFDFGAVAEGAGKIGPIVMHYTRDREWYSTIDMMNSLSNNDFELFKKKFFDNSEPDYRPNMTADEKKAAEKQHKQFNGHRGIEAFTFYVMSTLDKVIRNRTIEFEHRMEAITLMKALDSNKNFDTMKALRYRYYRSIDMRFMIRMYLSSYALMPYCEQVDDDLTDQLKEYAMVVLSSLFEGADQAQEWVNQNKKDLEKRFRWEDNKPAQTRNLLSNAMSVKVPMLKLYCSLRADSQEDYEKKIETINIIGIEGQRYYDGQRLEDKRDLKLLKEAIPKFLASTKQKVMLIQGEAGAGKTTLLLQTEHINWQRYSRGENSYVPIFVSLRSVKNPAQVLQHALASYNASNYAKSFKDGNTKFLLLLDGFDEMKQPVNLFEANDFDEWEDDIKVIITSNSSYLQKFNDYRDFFIADDNSASLVEYMIADLDDNQIRQYVIQMYTKYNDDDEDEDQMNQQEEEEQDEQEQEYQTEQSELPEIQSRANVTQGRKSKVEINFQTEDLFQNVMSGDSKYEIDRKVEEMIKSVKIFREVLKTPYMMQIIFDIMPELQDYLDDMPSGSAASAGLQIVYEKFTKRAIDISVDKLLESSPDDLPKGIDLKQSVYNYTCNFAMNLWLEDADHVDVESGNYPYPKWREEEKRSTRFDSFFTKDPKTYYSLKGSPIVTEFGKAKFTHKSIKDFFVARVLYANLKQIDLDKKPITSTYLDSKELDVVQDRKLLQFLTGMIQDNEMKLLDEKKKKGRQSLAKKLAQLISNEQSWFDQASPNTSIPTHIQNIFIISQNLPQVFSQLPNIHPESVQRILDHKDIDSSFKVSYGLAAAKVCAENSQYAQYKETFQRIAVAAMLGGKGSFEGNLEQKQPPEDAIHVNLRDYIFASGYGQLQMANGDYYEGEWQNNKMHGKGKLVYHDQRLDQTESENKRTPKQFYKEYVGNFEYGKKQGQGELTFGSHELNDPYLYKYIGEFSKDQMSGQGIRFYKGNHVVYVGEFKNQQMHGQGKLMVDMSDGNNRWVYEGQFKAGQLNGQGKITFGQMSQKSFLNFTVFEGNFEQNRCLLGSLLDANGQHLAQGRTTVTLSDGLKKIGLKFLNQEQLESGVHKTFIFYQPVGSNSVEEKVYAKQKEAMSDWASLKIDSVCSAKLLTTAQMVAKRANGEEQLQSLQQVVQYAYERGAIHSRNEDILKWANIQHRAKQPRPGAVDSGQFKLMQQTILASYTHLFEAQPEFKEVITGNILSTAPQISRSSYGLAQTSGITYGNTYSGAQVSGVQYSGAQISSSVGGQIMGGGSAQYTVVDRQPQTTLSSIQRQEYTAPNISNAFAQYLGTQATSYGGQGISSRRVISSSGLTGQTQYVGGSSQQIISGGQTEYIGGTTTAQRIVGAGQGDLARGSFSTQYQQSYQ